MSNNEVEFEEPARLRRAERVLRSRLSNVTLVLEKFSNEMNQKAVLRTAEAMGVQHVYQVKPTLPKRPANKQKERAKLGKGNDFEWGASVNVTSGCERWLSCKYFDTTEECIACLKEEGHAIWATDLSINAVCLDADFTKSEICPDPLPQKIALVMGSEAEGVTQEMLRIADLRVYLPMHGFTDSFNVGVAAALALSRVIDVVGRGPLPQAEQHTLRQNWIELLSTNPTITATLQHYVNTDLIPAPLDDLRDGRANPEGPRIIKKVRARQEQVQKEREKEALKTAASDDKTSAEKETPAGASGSIQYAPILVSAAAAFAMGYAVARR